MQQNITYHLCYAICIVCIIVCVFYFLIYQDVHKFSISLTSLVSASFEYYANIQIENCMYGYQVIEFP